MKGKMKWKLLAIIAEGENGRVYLNPNDDQEQIAFNIPSSWKPEEPLKTSSVQYTNKFLVQV